MMNTNKFPWPTFLWVTAFAIAMGYLETTVVVYLRALLYPHGFIFPLAPMPQSLALAEVLREAATLIMMLGVGILAGKSKSARFAWFIYVFAIWDIFYYVFLKALLNWPESLMTWDILFLIPIAWVSPVISPVIVSLTMIVLAVLIIRVEAIKNGVSLNYKEWIAMILGSLILIIAFTWDYATFMKGYSLSTESMLKLSLIYIPQKFNWFLFCMGEITIVAGIWMFWKRSRKCLRN